MKRAFTLIELLLVLACAGICAALALPVYNRYGRVHETVCKSSCASNQKQIWLGLMQYTQDHDEHLPPAAIGLASNSQKARSTPCGWVDAIQPYVKSTQILRCPNVLESIRRDKTPMQAGFTDYFFNLNLSALSLKRISQPGSVILLGDGNDGSGRNDARYNLRALPQAWFKDKTSPLWRHAGAANFLFADGHVKLILPNDLGSRYRFKPGAAR